jgi:hypothetical protein
MPATMTITGTATPRAIFAVPESPPEPEGEEPPGLVPPELNPFRRGS